MSDQPVGAGHEPDFSALSRVLVKYFPSPKNGGSNRTEELRDRFQKSGGSGLEFEGFIEQLRTAALDPDLASRVLYDTFGTALSPEDATDRLVDTYDFLTDGGKYSKEHQEAALRQAERIVDEAAAARPDTEELVEYYARRRIQLPGMLARLSAPIWVYLAASVAAMLVSAVLAYFVPTSWGVVHEIIVVPLHAVTAVSIIVALISGITMNGLRTERLRVGKTQKESRLGRFFKFN